MDKKIKIILGLAATLTVMVVVAVTPFSTGLMGYLQFFSQPVMPNIEVDEGSIPPGLFDSFQQSDIPGIASADESLFDDFFYIDRYDVAAKNTSLSNEPYDLPGVLELVDRNYDAVFDAGAASAAAENSYKVAVVYTDFDFEGQSYVFSEDEKEVLNNLKTSLPGTFEYAADFKVGLDTSYNLVGINVPEEEGFSVMYDWLSGSTAAKVSKIFYEKSPDDFDFIFFVGKHLNGMSRFIPVSEEMSGKGCNNSYGYEVHGDRKCQECFDYGEDFGSGGRLKGVVMMSVGREGDSEPLFDASTCALGMNAGASDSMLIDVHNVYNDYRACDLAFARLDEQIRAPYWLLSLMVHELEHYWALQVFPYDEELFFEKMSDFSGLEREMLLTFESFAGEGHFSYAAEAVDSVDPLGAVEYEWIGDDIGGGMVKVCLQNLYPYRPLKFHPVVQHFMGVDENLNMSLVYQGIDVFGDDGNGMMEFVKWEKDCAYLKPASQSRRNGLSLQNVVSFWGETARCE